MSNKIFKGISLILFGMLLCMGSGELNNVILVGVSYIPFPLFGVIGGVIGLIMIFTKGKDETGK